MIWISLSNRKRKDWEGASTCNELIKLAIVTARDLGILGNGSTLLVSVEHFITVNYKARNSLSIIIHYDEWFVRKNAWKIYLDIRIASSTSFRSNLILLSNLEINYKSKNVRVINFINTIYVCNCRNLILMTKFSFIRTRF